MASMPRNPTSKFSIYLYVCVALVMVAMPNGAGLICLQILRFAKHAVHSQAQYPGIFTALPWTNLVQQILIYISLLSISFKFCLVSAFRSFSNINGKGSKRTKRDEICLFLSK